MVILGPQGEEEWEGLEEVGLWPEGTEGLAANGGGGGPGPA